MIRLVAYDEAWPLQFETEVLAMRATLGELAMRIEHVGSTSVPGLVSKPVIYIQVSVPSLESLGPFIPPLAALGYRHRADPDPDFERVYPYFHKPGDWAHTHHLHLCQGHSEMEWKHVAFRDYLRANAAARDEYVALKRELATLHGGATHEGRQRYADAKSEFVARALAAVISSRS